MHEDHLTTARVYKLHVALELTTSAHVIRSAFAKARHGSPEPFLLETEYTLSRTTRLRKDADSYRHICATGLISDTICFENGLPLIAKRTMNILPLSPKFTATVRLKRHQSLKRDASGHSDEDYRYLELAHADAEASKEARRINRIIEPLNALTGYSSTFISLATLPPSLYNVWIGRDLSVRWTIGLIGTVSGLRASRTLRYIVVTLTSALRCSRSADCFAGNAKRESRF